jgi:hypothetical protein
MASLGCIQEAIMCRSLILNIALAGLVLFHVTAIAEPGYVIVDASDGYATTYVSLPKSLPQEKLNELKSKVTVRQGSYIEAWSSFIADLQRHVKANIKKDEYADVKTAEGLVAFLEKFEGTPIGLTWNGGLALTYNDYMFAQRTYQRYAANPAFVARPPDRRADPVHPSNHTEPLLGR